MEEDKQSHSPLVGSCICLLTLYPSPFYSPIALSPEVSKTQLATIKQMYKQIYKFPKNCKSNKSNIMFSKLQTNQI